MADAKWYERALGLFERAREEAAAARLAQDGFASRRAEAAGNRLWGFCDALDALGRRQDAARVRRLLGRLAAGEFGDE